MTLPVMLSVPHAGLTIPPEVRQLCILTAQQLREDSDEGAAEIYDLSSEVGAFFAADIARAVVDLNRSEDDRRADGAVKTHTCWKVPVYREPLPEELIQTLLAKYYRPYHQKLNDAAGRKDIRLGLDCHTMAAIGPPLGPDPGIERPHICLSNAEGACPRAWLEKLAACFKDTFGVNVALNQPFDGGYIIRRHVAELPWIQIELSRAPFCSIAEKRKRTLAALEAFCPSIF
jgi:N-formylglutamate deformylase